MAAKLYGTDQFPMRSYNPEAVRFSGSFAPNGSSAVSQDSIKGRGVKSVTRDGAGLFTIKSEANYQDLISHNLSVQLAAATDLKAQLVSKTLDASGGATFQIRLVAVATETDMSANANNRVSFEFELTPLGVT